MTINEALRAVAGTFLLLSLLLTYFVHPAWMWFTAFIGVNLLQSAFTGWCPMVSILKKTGLPQGEFARAVESGNERS